MKLVIVSVLLTLFLLGCSASTETSKTKQVNISPSKNLLSNNLQITIPPGWRVIKDNSDQLFEVWLINDQNSAAISFIPLYLSNIELDTMKDKLNIIAEISLNKRQAASAEFELINKDSLEVNNLRIVELKYLLEKNIQNLLIFTDGSQYYECLAYFNNDYKPNDFEIENLLGTQQEIVTELKFK